MTGLHRAWAVAALICLAGCSTWRVVEVSPAVLEPAPKQARVTLPDGSRVVVTSPYIQGDSLLGTRTSNPRDTIALPLWEVSRLAVPAPDREKTSALKLFLGVAVATFALWFALVLTGT